MRFWRRCANRFIFIEKFDRIAQLNANDFVVKINETLAYFSCARLQSPRARHSNNDRSQRVIRLLFSIPSVQIALPETVLFSWAVRHNYMASIPCSGIKIETSTNDEPVKILSIAETKHLLALA
jgi:hypothetical protein